MTKRKHWTDWAEATFRRLKLLQKESEILNVKFDCCIIMPSKRVHESGWRCIEFVPVKNNVPMGRISQWGHDVIDIDGIGGHGPRINGRREFSDMVPPKSWSIDCLPVSGLFRIFCGGHWLVFETLLSTVELCAVKMEAKK